MTTMRRLSLALSVAGSLVAGVAAAAPKQGNKGFDLVLNSPKLRADFTALKHDLGARAGSAAQSRLKALMRSGHMGYVYGDLGDMSGQLGQLASLGRQIGGKPVPKSFSESVIRYGHLVDMQHGLKEAALRKSAGDSFVGLGLGRAIRGAKALNMGSRELLGYLHGYGLTPRDVEQYTEYRFPR